jgi:hypothetical protein
VIIVQTRCVLTVLILTKRSSIVQNATEKKKVSFRINAMTAEE